MRVGPLPLVAALVAGCGPRTEPVWPVASDPAPLVESAAADARVRATLHRGELLVPVPGPARRLAWRGILDGKPAAREGEVVEVRRTGGEPGGFVFRSDLGGETRAPRADELCSRMGVGPECAGSLRRVAAGDATLGFVPCGSTGCPVAVARGRRLSTAAVDGLLDLRPLAIDGQEVALARVRWSRGQGWSGESEVVLRYGDGGVRRSLEVVTRDLDARSRPTVDRTGEVVVEGGALVYRGVRRTVGPLGEVLHTAPVVETYRLTRPR